MTPDCLHLRTVKKKSCQIFFLCSLKFFLCGLNFFLCSLKFFLCSLNFFLCSLNFFLCSLNFSTSGWLMPLHRHCVSTTITFTL